MAGGLDDVELRELRIFLALADELHFGRTADRLGVSQPAVSEAIRLLERRLGTKLFERSSRRVQLTHAGAELRGKLAPIVEGLERTLTETHEAASGVSGMLRIATTETTSLPPVVQLAKAFEAAHPGCGTQFVQADFADPYGVLRRGQADVVINWLAVDEPDLTAGPAIAYYDRVLAVGRGHRLAKRESVSYEEVADEQVDRTAVPLPPALHDLIIPPRTPGGRAIPRVMLGGAFIGILAAVALGRLVHPTMRGVTQFERDDIVLVPIGDLAPAPLGLIWRTASKGARVRALAEVARSEGPWPATDPVEQDPANTQEPILPALGRTAT
jgi:DNA-binding transcriptional LysR family regulator